MPCMSGTRHHREEHTKHSKRGLSSVCLRDTYLVLQDIHIHRSVVHALQRHLWTRLWTTLSPFSHRIGYTDSYRNEREEQHRRPSHPTAMRFERSTRAISCCCVMLPMSAALEVHARVHCEKEPEGALPCLRPLFQTGNSPRKACCAIDRSIHREAKEKPLLLLSSSHGCNAPLVLHTP